MCDMQIITALVLTNVKQFTFFLPPCKTGLNTIDGKYRIQNVIPGYG
jgi:hypothetical protein